LAPYILQIAIGIHAVFEGLAIGIENEPFKCITLAAAVCCHKWAEGITLGLAFKKANVELKMSTIMIAI
jgi:zinc transporter 1/2/3